VVAVGVWDMLLRIEGWWKASSGRRMGMIITVLMGLIQKRVASDLVTYSNMGR